MAHLEKVQAALQELPAGREVVLKLKDGSEVTGQVRETSEDAVLLDDAELESIELDRIEGVLLEEESEGPE